MKNKKIMIFKRNKKSQIFSTLVVVFVFFICGYAFYLYLTNQPKVEREIITPLSILDIYNQEQQINENNFNLLREAVHSSYIEMVSETPEFISQSCPQPNPEGFFILGSNCRIEDDADKKLVDSINSYLEDKNSDLIVSYSGENIVLESGEKTLNLEENKAMFPFKAEYKFKTKFSYPISTFYISSFSKIKSAIEICNKAEATAEEISSCLSSNLPEMDSEAIKEINDIKLVIKPKISLFDSKTSTLAQPEIKLQISI